MPHKDPEVARVYRRERQRKIRAANPQVAAYETQKSHAKARGIPFLISFDEWWDIWWQSGKWERRGRRRGQFVMARFGDQGAYVVGNVRICLGSENAMEATKFMSDETRERMRSVHKGMRHSEEARKNMSLAQKAAWLIPTRRKPASAEARQRMSEAGKARWARKNASHALGVASV
jgi:hypothetical protein